MKEQFSRRLLSVATALCVSLAAFGASALPLDFAALPRGEASAPPARTAAPRSIAGGRLAPGLFRVVPEQFRGPNMAGYEEYVFFTDAARASAYKDELRGVRPESVTRSDTCFAAAVTFRVPQQQDPRGVAWDDFTADRFTAQSYVADGMSSVVPVRAERFVTTGENARVETTQYWIDTRTGGSRLISRVEHALARVATPFAGVSVHALRTGADSVAFFVRRDAPESPQLPNTDPLALLRGFQLGRSRGETLDISMFRTGVGSEARTNPCAFERVDLMVRTDPPAESASAAAKPQALPGHAFLPFLAGRQAPEFANVVFAAVLDLAPEPRVPAPDESVMPPTPSEPGGTAQTRTMVVNLGLARSSAGAEPVPTVSYRWIEPRRTVPF